MSIFKQVLLVLVFGFLILFSIIVALSLGVIKNSTKESIYQNIQNSVTNLSLSITNAGDDESTIKTAINASFDNADFAKIVFKDTEDEVLYMLEKEIEIDEEIPTWFIKLIDIGEISAITSVSKSWQVLGVLEVFGDKSIYYEQTYRIFLKLIQSLFIGFIIFMIVLFLLFTFILKPLKTIRNQANAVMENRFIVSKEIPFTSEFKSVTLSINSMINKFEAMFKNTNEVLKTNKELLYFDEISKLNNRKYFVLKANECLIKDSLYSRGFIVLSSINIDYINKHFGYEKTNKILQDLSKILKDSFLEKDSVIARLNGSEFAVILPNEDEGFVKKVIEDIVYEVGKIEELENNIYFAMLEYQDEKGLKDLFTKMDYAISQAKLNSNLSYYYAQNISNTKTKEEWINIINSSLENDSFKILNRDIKDIKTSENILKTVNFTIENQDFDFVDFLAAIIKLDRINDVYFHLINKSLTQYNEKISIELPTKFVENLNNLVKFEEILQKYKNKKSAIFEIEEGAFKDNLKNSMKFIRLIKENGFDFAIYNFIANSDDFTYIKEEKPLYIKSSKLFLMESKQSLSMLKILTSSLGIKLIATSVEEKDLNELNDLEIDAVMMQIK